MKKEFYPYYLSRAVISAGFAVLVFGFTWMAAGFALLLFSLFLLYLHSGWFTVDTSKPLTPLRRDTRAKLIQRKALIAAILVGMGVALVMGLCVGQNAFSAVSGSAAVAAAVVAYFASQFILFLKA